MPFLSARKLGAGALTLAAASLASAAALAQVLTIALPSDPTAMDPHYHNVGPNNMLSNYVFDRLTDQDETQKVGPGLATSWQAVDDLTWEVKLRAGVTFHDGTPFTAEDVKFTVERAPNVPNSPSSFRIYVGPIAAVEIVDPLTVRLKTKAPTPLLPIYISTFGIISKKAAEGATTADFNSGKATIGTGPFRFVEWIPGNRAVYARNDAYWGDKPVWQRVTVRSIPNGSARVAALLAGDVDLIGEPPTSDIARLKKDAKLTVSEFPSNRVIYIHLDSARDQSPFITDKAGKPLARNPLKDQRVRKALSLAVNREAIVARVMEGIAVPAAQLLPDGFQGTSANLKVVKQDLNACKALLAEAGYPNGFRVTLHSPNDRYINDEKIAQAVGQFWTRCGVETKIEAIPQTVFFPRATKLEFSALLVGWGAATGETGSPLVSLLATRTPAKGWGASNRGGYSNPAMDAVVEEALKTLDDAKRNALLARASEIAINDVGLIPLHYEVSTWAMRKGLIYKGRADQYTLAQDISIAR